MKAECYWRLLVEWRYEKWYSINFIHDTLALYYWDGLERKSPL